MPVQRTAKILTAAVLVALSGIAVARVWRHPATAAPAGPQDAIYAMLNAARAGDVKSYLAAYTGGMEASIRQTIAEGSRDSFAKYLRDTAASVKGVALGDPEKISDSEVKVRVEYVYADRNEVQMVYLEKPAGVWRIARTDSGDRVPTLIPYGTPVK